MKRLHATLISLMILICCFSLSSCTEVVRLETQAIISAVGIDKGENERFKVTAQVFQSMGSGSASPIDPSKSNTAVIFAEADTVSEAMGKIEQSLGRQINTGHTKYIVIGRELLSYPLGDILGSFIADEQTYLGTAVLTAENTAEEIMKVQLLNDVETAVAVQNIIETATENGTALETDLLSAANSIIDKSVLPLPVISVEKSKKPSQKQGSDDSGSSGEAQPEPKFVFKGTRLLQEGKVVLVADERLTEGLCWLEGSIDTTKKSIKTDDADYTVSLSLSRHKLSLTRDKKGEYNLMLYLEVSMRIIESSRTDVDYNAAAEKSAELIKMLCYDTLEALDRADNCDFLRLEKLCLSQYPFTENLYDNILIDEPCVVSVNIHSDL